MNYQSNSEEFEEQFSELHNEERTWFTSLWFGLAMVIIVIVVCWYAFMRPNLYDAAVPTPVTVVSPSQPVVVPTTIRTTETTGANGTKKMSGNTAATGIRKSTNAQGVATVSESTEQKGQ